MTVNEQIAQAIEAERDDLTSTLMGNRYFLGLDTAAQIARDTSGWISTSSSLPEPNVEVLIYFPGLLPDHSGGIHIAKRRANGEFWATGGFHVWPTHWQSLPQPPRP